MSECSETCAPHLFQHCSPECEREARMSRLSKRLVIDGPMHGQWLEAGDRSGYVYILELPPVTEAGFASTVPWSIPWRSKVLYRAETWFNNIVPATIPLWVRSGTTDAEANKAVQRLMLELIGATFRDES